MSEGQYWENHTQPINNATLKTIAAQNQLLNSTEGQFVVATQVFPIKDSSGGSMRDKDNNILYEALIYYKKNPNTTKQLNPKTGVAQDKPLPM